MEKRTKPRSKNVELTALAWAAKERGISYGHLVARLGAGEKEQIVRAFLEEYETERQQEEARIQEKAQVAAEAERKRKQ